MRQRRAWSEADPHWGPVLGIPPTGKQVTVAAWEIDQVVDGKIAACRLIMDMLGLLQQLGAIPSPDQVA
jgi:predicted ester cyclase